MQFDPKSPFYADSKGSAVHIGDIVFYVSRGSNGSTTKSGTVEEIHYKSDSVTVKVSGRKQHIGSEQTTLIGDSTLEDRLRRMVSESRGLIDEGSISELASAIRAGDYQ